MSSLSCKPINFGSSCFLEQEFYFTLIAKYWFIPGMDSSVNSPLILIVKPKNIEKKLFAILDLNKMVFK